MGLYCFLHCENIFFAVFRSAIKKFPSFLFVFKLLVLRTSHGYNFNRSTVISGLILRLNNHIPPCSHVVHIASDFDTSGLLLLLWLCIIITWRSSNQPVCEVFSSTLGLTRISGVCKIVKQVSRAAKVTGVFKTDTFDCTMPLNWRWKFLLWRSWLWNYYNIFLGSQPGLFIWNTCEVVKDDTSLLQSSGRMYSKRKTSIIWSYSL